MTTAASPGPTVSDSAGSRAGRWLRASAAVLLIATAAGRCFLGELPSRTSALQYTWEAIQGEEGTPVPQADRGELARVTFAMLLLAAMVLWLGAEAAGGVLRLPRKWLWAMAAVFVAWGFVSAMGASNRRDGLTVWIEQVSLIASAMVASSVLSRRGRWLILVVVLVGVGAALTTRGAMQWLVDIPERIADFEANRPRRLAMVNVRTGTPLEKLMAARVYDQAPFGFASLANIFASLLLLPAAAAVGLAAAKWKQARRPERSVDRGKGEIDPAWLSVGLTALVATAMVWMLVLTESRGALAAAAATAVCGAVLWKFRAHLPTHSTVRTVAVLAVLAVPTAALLAAGAFAGPLSVKTLQFRWQYWMASAAMWAEHFWLGVGGGNFGDGYLAYRLMGAEEAVKAPHNLWMHALAQFGLGGVLFVTRAAAIAAGSGPRAREENNPPHRAELVLTLAGVVVVAVAARTLLWDWSTHAAVWTWEVLLPAMGLVAGLVLAAWRLTGGGGLRFCLRAGLLAVLVHNIVTYSLWTPATAGLFWLTGGALIEPDGPAPRKPGRSWARWSLVGLATAGWVAAAVWLWTPVYRRTTHADAVLHALREGDQARAIAAADGMVLADPLDPRAADDAAKLMLMLAPRNEVRARLTRLGQAEDYAATAWERDGADFTVAHRRVMTRWYREFPDAFALTIQRRIGPGQVEQFRKAVTRRQGDWLGLHDLAAAYALDGRWHEAVAWFARVAQLRPKYRQAQYNEALATWMAGMQDRAREAWRNAGVRKPPEGFGELVRVALLRNPRDARVRLDYAEMVLQTGSADWARQLLCEAAKIDAALDPDSVQKLSKQELERIGAMEAHAAVVEEMAEEGG